MVAQNIEAVLAQESVEITAEMQRLLVGTSPRTARLYEAMLYSVEAGGKRVRPFLTLEFCRLFGGIAASALPYAAAIELIHTMSLVHDDLPAMDDDVLRRGKPTNHVVFGEATALLAGDALLALAFSAAAGNPHCTAEQNLLAVKSLAFFGGAPGMMGGQQIDLDSEGKKIDRETLLEMCEKKTGALIACACALGAIAAGAGEESVLLAQKFGKYLGMAFQMQDDLLDVTADEAALGKTVGKDARDEKSTFVTLFGQQKCAELAEDYSRKAKECLDGVGDDVARRRLLDLCDYLLKRDH